LVWFGLVWFGLVWFGLVWFGESVPEFDNACKIAIQADLLLVIGTSLQVYPAASLLDQVRFGIPVFLVSPDMDFVPANVTWYQENAATKLPELVESFINKGLVG